ncbi:hypothetical protein IWW54_006046, partial [Coemansia sp. RSA 2705]
HDPSTYPERPDAKNPDGLPELTIVKATLDGVPANIAYIRKHVLFAIVIVSMVLCSFDNVRANLQAIQTLLVPGSKFIFIKTCPPHEQ